MFRTDCPLPFGEIVARPFTSLISSMSAMHLMNKRSQGFLAMVKDAEAISLGLDQVPVVRDFPDVFPEELPGMPPNRVVKFYIDLVPSVQPVSIPPHHIAPT